MWSKYDFVFVSGVFVCVGFVALIAMWATKGAPMGEMTCYRNGVEIKTTMHELRKPGPYVIGETTTGRVIAIAKDGIRCSRG